MIPLLHLAPHSSASFVFTEFDSQNGWSSKGTSWFIGLLSGVFPFLGESSFKESEQGVTEYHCLLRIRWSVSYG